MTDEACPSGVFLGYRNARPWLWLVDIEQRRVEPTATSLPGNDIAVSEIVSRNGWLAVHTHQTPWSVPASLDEPGRRLADTSFTFVPRLDGETLWIQPADEPDGHTVAVTAAGEAVDRMVLDQRDRLVGETNLGHLVRRDGNRLALLDREGRREELGTTSWLQVVSADVVAWTDQERREVLHLRTSDDTHHVTAADIAAWHHAGSLSPDGRTIAVGGDATIDSLDESSPAHQHPSRLALIDVASGEVSLSDGTFPNFAWPPAWTGDSSWVVFNAPFSSRRLYGMQRRDNVLHEWRFRVNPPAPMLDVSRPAAQ